MVKQPRMGEGRRGCKNTASTGRLEPLKPWGFVPRPTIWNATQCAERQHHMPLGQTARGKGENRKEEKTPDSYRSADRTRTRGKIRGPTGEVEDEPWRCFLTASLARTRDDIHQLRSECAAHLCHTSRQDRTRLSNQGGPIGAPRTHRASRGRQRGLDFPSALTGRTGVQVARHGRGNCPGSRAMQTLRVSAEAPCRAGQSRGARPNSRVS